jgi:localization factor PodJL
VHEIADQVAQLAHVVELLAGAVGETGQVKRLESQIAALARSVERAPSPTDQLGRRIEDLTRTVTALADMQKHYGERADATPANARLDDVSATLGRLADLQVEGRNRVETDAKALHSGMASIEVGIRHVYDRVDMLERQLGTEHPGLERVMGELRDIAVAARAANPAGLAGLVDKLAHRISELELRVPGMADLQASSDDLRQSLEATLQPRFEAIEDQLTTFGDRLPKAGEPGLSAIEAQVKDLLKRTDSTGRQLVAIAQLSGPPDYDVIAEKSARRTLEGLSVLPRMGASDLDAIEARVARLLDSPGRGDTLAESLALRASLRTVTERVERLETSRGVAQPHDDMPVDPASDVAVPPFPEAQPLSFERISPTGPAFTLPPAPVPAEELRDDAADSAMANFAAEVSEREAGELPEGREPGDNPLLGRAIARLMARDTGATAQVPVPVPAPEPVSEPPAEVISPVPPVETRRVDRDTRDFSVDPIARPFLRRGLSRRMRVALLIGLIIMGAVGVIVLINQRLSAALLESAQAPLTTGAIAPVFSGTPVAQLPLVGTLSVPPAESLSPTDPLRTGSVIAGQLLEFVKSGTPVAVPNQFVREPESAPDAAEALAAPADLLPPATLGPAALIAAAGRGDARAQFEIAVIYTEGRAVPADLTQAALWYQRAAVQGFAPAQYRLATFYETGRGVARDPAEARRWYEHAAEAGNRLAMHNLAVLYSGGALGAPRYDRAAHWFEEAARRGVADSQFNLGALYARGLGVTADLKRAYHWFALAAGHGDEDARIAFRNVAASMDSKTRKQLDAALAVWAPISIELPANYAPIGTWDRGYDPGTALKEPSVVKGVQRTLKALGFSPAEPNGMLDSATTMAISAFEEALGMAPSGKVNPRLLAVLGSQPV